ncbi:MAG: STAS/SEC14 domain-containing protein [Actinomycetales bacterium]
MITQLTRSHDNILGFGVEGDVTKEDYQVLVPAVQAALESHATVSLLLDLVGFHWEKVSAWGADLRFGATYHDKIARMAIVGDHTWEKWLAKLADPFYARQAQYFTTHDEAWAWLEEA